MARLLARQQQFFLETARARLAESGRAQRLTRARVLARAWPIGADLDPAGTVRALTLLTDGDPGWAARLDALGIAHGAIQDASYGSGLSFRDPDNIALELFCPPG